MWFYYQTAENCQQAWTAAQSSQEDSLRVGPAFHIGIYHVDKLVEAAEQEDIKYKGDLWFDIDHKPETDTPTEEDYREAIQRSIMDARRLLDYLDTIGMTPDYCRIFASGGKGFHIAVPGRVFGGAGTYGYLPRIHKLMAEAIEERSYVDGLDTSLYACGKGKMLRVENKERANGKFKTPVTWAEVQEMTYESYLELTSEPRQLAAMDPPKSFTCHELAVLFAECREQIKEYSRISFQAVASEHLEEFSDGQHPVCIQWLVSHTAIAQNKGAFNGAKMSLARYVMSAPITDEERNSLVQAFANSWTSTRHPTPQSRTKAVKETLKFGQEQGFSCEMICRSFDQNPCNGCPIKEIQRAKSADRTGIVDQKGGYRRLVIKGEGPLITNFTLKPVRRYIDENDHNKFLAFDYEVIEQVGGNTMTTCNITLDSRAWLSSSEFKKQIMRNMRLSYTGTDQDLQFLRAYLTSPELNQEVETVTTVSTLGIHHHVDLAREIDEFVWVQDDWSLGRTITDTLSYSGRRSESGGRTEHVTLDMRRIEAYDPHSSKQEEAMFALLTCNRAHIVAPILGWVCACWLREHLRSRGTDRHFPALQVWGASGVGKTETTTMFSLLAGADYYHHDPITVSGSTPFAIREEGASTTTVPRILDEMNEHKILEKQKYRAAAEVVKACARGSSLPQGAMGKANGGIVVDKRLASSPIIFLATQENTEKELQQRSISLYIDGRFKLEKDHTRNFEFARANEEHLFPWAKSMMLAALQTQRQWVFDTMDKNKLMMPSCIRDRPAQNWTAVLTGLDFFQNTFSSKECPASPRILNRIMDLKLEVVGLLKENKESLAQQSNQQEIDIILDKISELAAQVDGNNQRRLAPGIHYLVQDDQLHLFSTAVFPMYVRYMRDMGRVPELSDLKQFRSLLSSRPYYLGEGLAKGVKAASSWHTLDIKDLRTRGIHIDNFQE